MPIYAACRTKFNPCIADKMTQDDPGGGDGNKSPVQSSPRLGTNSLLANSLTISCVYSRLSQLRSVVKSTLKVRTMLLLSMVLDLMLGWFVQSRIVEEFKLKVTVPLPPP